MKTLSWLLFGMMVLAQWAAPLHQVIKHEQVLAEVANWEAHAS